MTLAIALLAAAAVGAQVAVAAKAHADTSSTVTPASTNAAIADARAQAVKTGTPVQIDALTTSTETVAADPSGLLSLTESVYPTRVRRGDGWVPVDTTLHTAGDGTLVPAAAPSTIAFSAGGSGHLATMTSGGRTLSLDWPGTLPAPSVSGSSAVYADVFPGVDLTVTATPLGGYTEVLTVKNATAADDPGLASLHLTTHTVGLSVNADSDSNLTATDPTGQPYFNAPAPGMWDSSTDAGSTSEGTSTARSAQVAPATSGPDDPVVSSEQGPGSGAQTAQISSTVSNGTLTLTPDTTVLQSAATTFPVYLSAPGWNPNTAADPKESYDEVQQGCPSKNALNSSTAPYNTPGVGLNDYSGCIGIERAYYQFKVDTRLWYSTATPVEIVKATLKATEAYSASCSVTSNVNLYGSGPISTSTTWDQQPTRSTFQDVQPIGPACTSNPSPGFDISNAAGDASQYRWSAMAFVLEAADESNDIDFRRFANNPTVTVLYNTSPKVTGVSTTPPTSCGSTTAPIVPLTTIGNTTISLRANVSDPDKGAPVYADFTLKTLAGTTVKTAVQPGPVTQSGTLTWNIGTLPSGTYKWTATADDLESTSQAKQCEFTVDATAPGIPTITSTAYPPTDNAPADQRLSGGGAFTFTHAPGDTGTASYAYNWGSQPPTVNPPHTVTADANGNAVVTLNPTGVHNDLFVVAIDEAGNQSHPDDYAFNLVAPTSEPVAGDVTGDGKPDLLVPGTNGALRLYAGTGSGKLASPVEYAAPPSFAHALIGTGDINQDLIQDVVTVQSDGKGNTYAYANYGNDDAEADSLTSDNADPVEALSTLPFNWSDVTHLVVASGIVGGIPGDASGDGNGPDMFATTTDGSLWLLKAGTAYPSVDSVMLLNSGWGNETIVDAGDVAGYPALWARNDTTGELDLYTSTGPDDPAGSPVSAANKITSTTVLTSAAYPQLYTAGDANGDGLPDLWAVDSNAVHSVWFLPSTTTAGTLGTKTLVQTLSPHDDFNGDGHADVMDDWSDGTLHEHLGNGTTGTTVGGQIQSGLTLAPQLWDSSWNSVRLMTPGDFNGDGYSDIAVIYSAGTRASQLWLYPGTVNGGLGDPHQMDIAAGSNWGTMQQIVAGDFNGNGTTDLAAVWNDGTLHYYPGNGNGDVTGNQQIGTSTTWNTITLYAASDFNNDAKTDLLDIWFDGTMHVHTSSTDTSSNVTMTAGSSIGSNWGTAKFLMAGDFNADGKPDRLDVYSGQLRYSQGNGNGTFGAPIIIDPSTAWGTMRLVD